MIKIKRFAALFLCVALCFGIMSVVAFAEGEESASVIGDIDGDCKVTTDDARIALQMACGVVAEDVLTADFDLDGFVSVADAFAILRKASTIGNIVIPDKNGDNFLSDDPNNEFIKLISSKYNLDVDSLVAIYSVPDSGTNYVLQFKKKLIGNGYNKSTSGLEKVYHIGSAPERKISYTDGELLEGASHHYNCTAAEGWITFNLVKNEVMAQYPTYFK